MLRFLPMFARPATLTPDRRLAQQVGDLEPWVQGALSSFLHAGDGDSALKKQPGGLFLAESGVSYAYA